MDRGRSTKEPQTVTAGALTPVCIASLVGWCLVPAATDGWESEKQGSEFTFNVTFSVVAPRLCTPCLGLRALSGLGVSHQGRPSFKSQP